GTSYLAIEFDVIDTVSIRSHRSVSYSIRTYRRRRERSRIRPFHGSIRVDCVPSNVDCPIHAHTRRGESYGVGQRTPLESTIRVQCCRTLATSSRRGRIVHPNIDSTIMCHGTRHTD